MLRGIDVSNNNGAVDWAAVSAGGVGYAFLKATEGTSFVDVFYAPNRTAARAHGIRAGGYHFARPGQSGPEQQAEHFLSIAHPEAGDLLPVLDLEDHGGLPTAAVQRWTAGWLRAVERELGLKPIIYSGPFFWRSRVGNANFARHPLWLAQYTTAKNADVPGAWPSYTIWQYTSDGSVPGVHGRCDVNRCEDGALDAITIGEVRPQGIFPELHPGARSPEVAELKRALRAYFKANRGLTKARFTMDTTYGPQTVRAVQDFQTAHGLEVDGIVGELTWAALEAEYAQLRLGSHPH